MTIHEDCEARGIARWALVQLRTYVSNGAVPDDIAAYVTERFGTDGSRTVLRALAETAGVDIGAQAAVDVAALARSVEARREELDRGER